MQIFTVMFFGFSGEKLKSTSICIALLFAFDINFLTHVEYNLENDIWILSSVTFCQLNQLFSNSEVVMLSSLAMPINSTLKFHLKGFIIFFNYQIKRI